MSRRYDGDEKKKDIHEANIAYLQNCRTAALYAAQKLGWHLIECAENGEAKPIQNIAREVRRIVSKEL